MSSTQAVTAFVNFPSPYTQNLLVKALVSTLDSISISLVPPSEEDPPRLQWYVLSFLAVSGMRVPVTAEIPSTVSCSIWAD
jgi:hypothetical protein